MEAYRVTAKSETELTEIRENKPQFSFERESHSYRLVLSYPLDREFLDDEDLKVKIGEFHDQVLKPEQYTIRFRVEEVGYGKTDDYYLLSFKGTFASEYIDHSEFETVDLLVTQLAAYFTCVREDELRAIFYQIDGQTILEPETVKEGVPESYNGENIWIFLSSLDGFEIYLVAELAAELLGVVAEAGFSLLDFDSGSPEGAAAAIHVAGESGGEALVEGSEAAGGALEALGETASGASEVAGEAAGEAASALAEGAGALAEGAGEVAGGAAELIGSFIELVLGLFSS